MKRTRARILAHDHEVMSFTVNNNPHKRFVVKKLPEHLCKSFMEIDVMNTSIKFNRCWEKVYNYYDEWDTMSPKLEHYIDKHTV